MITQISAIKDVVLVGSGHAHVQILKQFAMRPVHGARLILISDRSFAPYSGMLPGYLAGWYDFNDIHFDLRQICQKAGAVFIQDTVVGIDTITQEILLSHRTPLKYDLASINVGSTPSLEQGELPSNLLPLKPIAPFLQGWKSFQEILNKNSNQLRVALVGGGASGIEVSMIIKKQLTKINSQSSVHLFQSGDGLLPGHSARAGKKLEHELKSQGVNFYLSKKATKFDGHKLHFENSESQDFDFVFWATQACAPEWFKKSGLPTSVDGFLRVDATLNVLGFENLFGAGDCIEFNGQKLPKSGVYAVRQGPILGHNLRARLTKMSSVKKYNPQGHALALITLGDKNVLASRGALVTQGRYLWRLKDKIDRKFMKMFSTYDDMTPKSFDEIPAINKTIANTCGGCGAKINPDILSRLMKRLPQTTDENVLIGLSQPDDAAVIANRPGYARVESVDFFRTFTNDLYFFGQVAALHSLSDIYAMGAIPHTAMATVTLPAGPKVEEDLYQLMSGALEVLRSEGITLVGGHSVEGQEVGLGFAVSGYQRPEKIWRKSGAKVGDAIILTKALGSGLILNAHMSGLARGDWIESLYSSLLLSSKEVIETLASFDIHAATDVTGFGLLGHLGEMLKPQNLGAQIDLSKLRTFAGFFELYKKGVRSSLSGANRAFVSNICGPISDEFFEALTDPQTCGGLLLAIPAPQVPSVLAALKNLGFNDATDIARVTPGPLRIEIAELDHRLAHILERSADKGL